MTPAPITCELFGKEMANTAGKWLSQACQHCPSAGPRLLIRDQSQREAASGCPPKGCGFEFHSTAKDFLSKFLPPLADSRGRTQLSKLARIGAITQISLFSSAVNRTESRPSTLVIAFSNTLSLRVADRAPGQGDTPLALARLLAARTGTYTRCDCARLG